MTGATLAHHHNVTLKKGNEHENSTSNNFYISYFILFKKGLNDLRTIELYGKKGVIIGVVFFAVINYPYIGEVAIYFGEKGLNIYVILTFIYM